MAQTDINQMDANGERDGVWKKTYPGTTQIRYEGQFDHGKEVGTFKYYCQECGNKPTIVKEFDPDNNLAKVQYFTIKGKLVSEGKMKGEMLVGEWLFFHKKSKEVMTREFYEDGKLEGKKTVYYPNGKITEEINYIKGLAEGENNYYSPDGVLLKKLLYKNDVLEGPAFYYDAKGKLLIEGQYKKGKKDGVWKYYKNGILEKEEIYPKPLKN